MVVGETKGGGEEKREVLAAAQERLVGWKGIASGVSKPCRWVKGFLSRKEEGAFYYFLD